MTPTTTARVMGGLSVGAAVGLAVCPRPLLALFGIPARAGLGRLLAVRDVVTGVGLMTTDRPEPWLRARATFDALDGVLVALNGRGRGPVTTLGRLVVAAASSGLSWSAAERAAALSHEPAGRTSSSAG